MKKYVGKYRVVCEFDRATLNPIKEDMYIQCSKSGQIYRINNDTLAYYKPARGQTSFLCNKLVELGVKDVKDMSTTSDILIAFNEDSIDIVANEFGANTTGANVVPTSIRNLRKLKWFKDNKDYYIKQGLYKEMTEEEKEKFRKRFVKIK